MHKRTLSSRSQIVTETQNRSVSNQQTPSSSRLTNINPTPKCFSRFNESLNVIPGVSTKPTLVLDLDEVLIHTTWKNTPTSTLLKLPITQETVMHVTDRSLGFIPMWVAVRQGVCECIRKLSEKYEIVIWTAAVREYANVVMEHLGVLDVVAKVLCRENCIYTNFTYKKALHTLGRDLEQIIIVDDKAVNFIEHFQCGIEMKPFQGENDSLFETLTEYLIEFAKDFNLKRMVHYW